MEFEPQRLNFDPCIEGPGQHIPSMWGWVKTIPTSCIYSHLGGGEHPLKLSFGVHQGSKFWFIIIQTPCQLKICRWFQDGWLGKATAISTGAQWFPRPVVYIRYLERYLSLWYRQYMILIFDVDIWYTISNINLYTHNKQNYTHTWGCIKTSCTYMAGGDCQPFSNFFWFKKTSHDATGPGCDGPCFRTVAFGAELTTAASRQWKWGFGLKLMGTPPRKMHWLIRIH